MTFDERVTAVSELGFTTRQVRFLVTLMLHGGVCVPKQYARFAGTAYGHKVNMFFDRLVSLRYAVRCRCVHNRAACYHVPVPGVRCPVTDAGPELSLFVLHQTGLGWPGGRCDNYRKVPT